VPRSRRIGLQRGREIAPRHPAQTSGGGQHGRGTGKGQGATHGQGKGAGRGAGTAAVSAFAAITAKAAAGIVNQPNSLAILRGVINTDGTVASGTGFTVGPTPAGHFVISFAPAFAAAPVVIAIGGKGSTNRTYVNYDVLAATGVDVYLYTHDGILDPNTPLAFVAVGGTLPGDLPIIRGVINTDGTVASGTGFTVGPAPAGHFVISFASAFAAAPVVVATGGKGSTNRALVNYDALATTGVDVYLHTSSGSLDPNTPLAFVAVGAG